MTCSICEKNTATRSAVIDGEYYANICEADFTQLQSGQTVSSGAADWNRTIDAEDHEADMQQPFANGKPNPKFIAAYPSQAKRLFTEEQMRDANR